MKLIVSSDGLCTINAEKVKMFWVKRETLADVGSIQKYLYTIYADDKGICSYKSLEDAKKSLQSVINSLTSGLSDIALRMENIE